MESKPSSDYFGSFLKSIQESEPVEASVAEQSLKFMTTLAASGRIEVVKLISESGLNFVEFSDMVKQLKEKGLIELDDSNGHEIIGLSMEAEQIVRAITFSQDDST
jgi:predicted transcriptional regulator